MKRSLEKILNICKHMKKIANKTCICITYVKNSCIYFLRKDLDPLEKSIDEKRSQRSLVTIAEKGFKYCYKGSQRSLHNPSAIVTDPLGVKLRQGGVVL